MMAARSRSNLTKAGAFISAAILSTAIIAIAQGSELIKNRVPEAELEAAFRRLKRNDSLQFDLPDAAPAPRLGWLERLGRLIADFFTAIGPLLKVVFWLGIGALAAGAIYLIAQTIYSAVKATRDRETAAVPDAPAPLYQPEQQQARILLDEIDALAAQGKFKEAVHTLLFRSIQDIDANRPNVIRRSLTSREIGALSILTPKAQEAFSGIAEIVERSYFGGQEIGRTEFETARAAYTSLALGEAADKLIAA